MSTTPKRFQFDPSAAMAADEQITKTELEGELDKLETEIGVLSGKLINLARKVFEDLQADDDQPLVDQLTNARAARDKLQAILNGAKGASSTTLSPDEQELLDLFRTGKIKFVTGELDDPANPGQTMPGKSVLDTRRARRRGSNPAPAQGSGPAPAPTSPPVPGPAAPAPSNPAQPSNPAPQNPPAPPVVAPAPDPAQAAPASPTPSGNGQPASPATPAGSGGQPDPNANPAPSSQQGPLMRAYNWVKNH